MGFIMTDRFTPKNTITLRGEVFQVEPFTDLSLVHIMTVLRDGTKSDFQTRSNAGAEIKEVIVPSISNEMISVNRNGKYIFHLTSDEMAELFSQLVLIFYQRNYQKIIGLPAEKQDKEELKASERMIGFFYKEKESQINNEEQITAKETVEILESLSNEEMQDTFMPTSPEEMQELIRQLREKEKQQGQP